MKRIFLISLLFFTVTAFSQQKPLSPEKDVLIRKGLACQYLKENYFDYKTGTARAAHNLLLEVYKKHAEIAPVDLNTITDSGDRANLQSFIGGLSSIELLTPTWNDLLTLEKNKVLQEDRAMRRTPYYPENK
jgi:hypothetical protein